MRTPQATFNLLAVSAYARETAINVEQDLDLSLLVGMGDVLNINPLRRDNADDATGGEEATEVSDMGQRVSGPLTFKRAQPHQIAFLLAYALQPSVSTDVPGSTGGRKHVYTPSDNWFDEARGLPSFTAAQRYAKVFKRRLASCFVNSLTFSFPKNDFVQATADIQATGKVTSSMGEELVTALDNVTVLTLAANAVNGSTDQERLDSVHQIIAEYPAASDIWVPVTYTAVSDDAPAVITIASVGGSGASTTYKVFYAALEPGTDWRTFPARVTEPPLKTSEFSLTVGGKWDGSAIAGGRILTSEVGNFSFTLNNNMQVEGTMGGGADYANRALRDPRTQKLTLSRELMDAVWQELRLIGNTTFSIYAKAEGALLNVGETARYTFGICWPLCALSNSAISADGKRLVESPDITVLRDATHGSVYAWVINKGTAYAGV